MSPFASRKRVALLLLALLLAIANVIWFSTKAAPEIDDFKIELTSHALNYEAKAEQNYPIFGMPGARWSLDGRPLKSVTSYMIDVDPEGIGPDSIGKYLAFRMADGAGSDAVRHALLALTSEGICQFAILDRTNRQGHVWQALVYKVRTVRNDDGKLVNCEQRV